MRPSDTRPARRLAVGSTACQHRDICGGNTRVRAWQLTGDPWQEDPACYLTNDEIGVSDGGERLQVTPWTRQRESA